MWLTLLVAFTAQAQAFNTQWISAPSPDSLSHVWFRQSYLCSQRPLRATVTVASTGLFKVFVNGFIVGTATYYPVRTSADNTPRAITFDVTRYLRNDTNTVAVLYAPVTPMNADPRQIAVAFYGISGEGTRFSYHSDGNWLCRLANARWNEAGGETIDGRRHNTTWNKPTFDPALWTPVLLQDGLPGETIAQQRQCYAATMTTHSRSYESRYSAGDSISYDFGQAFIGGVSVTLREASKGECIQISNMKYICSGELDEQAYPSFPRTSLRQVTICGDRRFRQSQIFDIMTLETATKRVFNWNE